MPGLNLRSMRSAMRFRDGQNAWLRNGEFTSTRQVTTKIPVLGDLPLVGALFRKVTEEEFAEEYLLLVTVRILDPDQH